MGDSMPNEDQTEKKFTEGLVEKAPGDNIEPTFPPVIDGLLEIMVQDTLLMKLGARQGQLEVVSHAQRSKDNYMRELSEACESTQFDYKFSGGAIVGDFSKPRKGITFGEALA